MPNQEKKLIYIDKKSYNILFFITFFFGKLLINFILPVLTNISFYVTIDALTLIINPKITIMMQLKCITCSGPNEHTNKDELLTLLEEFPLAEIAVQVSEKKCLKDMPRYQWIHNLQQMLMCERLIINAAIHVNLQWCNDFAQGKIAPDLMKILSLRDYNGDLFFKRVQLNFTIGITETPQPEMLYNVFRSLPQRRFIVPYNRETAEIVHDLYRMGAVFDCLYDESFGKGIVPATREPAVFPDIVQGYAGGITPDNVEAELEKIVDAYARVPNVSEVFIDAHKGLENAEKHFDIAKCRHYLQKATSWYHNYQESAACH